MSTPHRDDNRPERASRSRGTRRRTLEAPRSIESYLRANSAPRYLLRLRDLEREFRAHVHRLETAYAEALESAGGDAQLFARRWRGRASAWRFDHLNQLIRDHNLWYPMESSLPMDPRTGDYRLVRGASYRRVELDSAWILDNFPTDPVVGPRIDRRALAPREPVERRARALRRAAS